MHRPGKIISGGQTGADLGGLVAAKKLGIATGGSAPRGYKTEAGEQPQMLKAFGLAEDPSSVYSERTKANVVNSDATLIIATDPESDGTKLTAEYCEEYEKPYLLIEPGLESVALVREFIDSKKPGVLNVAGNRESKSKGIGSKTEAILLAVFDAADEKR